MAFLKRSFPPPRDIIYKTYSPPEKMSACAYKIHQDWQLSRIQILFIINYQRIKRASLSSPRRNANLKFLAVFCSTSTTSIRPSSFDFFRVRDDAALLDQLDGNLTKFSAVSQINPKTYVHTHRRSLLDTHKKRF